MQVFRSLPPTEHRLPCALTIGNFDGVHRGHRALLERVRDVARERGLRACVLTFEPHPREFFAARNPGLQAPTRIATLRDKLQALSDAGIDAACVVHFNDRFASLAPSEFIRRILVDGLRTRWLLIGDDFRFGARRQGDFAALKEAAGPLGFEVHSMPTVADAGLRISSSAVRAALARGQLDEAAHLLGRPYAISGHVVHGRKLGRELGFPTLNVRIPHGRPALAGIFVVKVHGLTGQGRRWPAWPAWAPALQWKPRAHPCLKPMCWTGRATPTASWCALNFCASCAMKRITTAWMHSPRKSGWTPIRRGRILRRSRHRAIPELPTVRPFYTSLLHVPSTRPYYTPLLHAP